MAELAPSGPALCGRILAAIGKAPGEIRPADIRTQDEFHIGGGAATERLLDPLGLPPGTRVLDIGAGLGGPARRMAARYGWAVTGLDLAPEFVATARRLSELAGDTACRFVAGSALDLPFAPESFDLATLLHVGMNIADKPRLMAGIARILRPGGRLAIYDVMASGPRPPDFPLPWAETAAASHLAPPEAYRAAAAAAGLDLLHEADRSAEARAALDAAGQAARAGKARGAPPAVMGENGREKVANLAAALEAGDIAPREMIFGRP